MHEGWGDIAYRPTPEKENKKQIKGWGGGVLKIPGLFQES
jgi:hypothetical protein